MQHNSGRKPRPRRDSLPTTWKKAWRALAANAALELIPRGTSFGVSIVASPLAGGIVGKATKRALRYMLHRYTHVYEQGEIRLSELIGREIPDRRYKGVGDFWATVLQHGLDDGALVEISGLLSAYGPLMPAHPMSRPGYTVEGWEALGEIESEDTEEYDARDGFIYGDRVIRLSRPRRQKYYAGLYDPYFGISNVSIPLYVDQAVFGRRHRDLKALWLYPMVAGKIVRLKGRLIQIPSYYEQFDGQLPGQYCKLPSFGLEIFKIDRVVEPDGVTHMAVTVSWDRRGEERMLTHYFNVQDRKQFETAEELLCRAPGKMTTLGVDIFR